MAQSIAVLIPCYNEEQTIHKVVLDFHKELPHAKIYVYDNRSSDRTVAEASRAGAILGFEYKQGKGNVVRTMFREINADLYVMVDGDATYPAERVHDLIGPVSSGRADMTVATRLDRSEEKSFRLFHKFGNELVRSSINMLFRAELRDILSGYRCFSARFVKSVPILSRGFEVETELTLQALDKNFIIQEVPVEYFKRQEGSHSKLDTFGDGLLVLKTILLLFKDYKPLQFFGAIGLFCLLAGLALGSIPITDYLHTGNVFHPSTAVLATGLILIGLLMCSTGLVLDTIKRRHYEYYYIVTDYLLQHGIGKREEMPSLTSRSVTELDRESADRDGDEVAKGESWSVQAAHDRT